MKNHSINLQSIAPSILCGARYVVYSQLIGQMPSTISSAAPVANLYGHTALALLSQTLKEALIGGIFEKQTNETKQNLST